MAPPSSGPDGRWKTDDAVSKFFPNLFERDLTTHLLQIAEVVADLSNAGSHVRAGVAVAPESLDPGNPADFEPATGTVRMVNTRARLVGELMTGVLDGHPEYWPAALEALATAIHESAHGVGHNNPFIYANQYNSWDHPSGEPGRYVSGARAFREGMTELFAVTQVGEVAKRLGLPDGIAAAGTPLAFGAQNVAACQTILTTVAALSGTDTTTQLNEVISRNASRDSLDLISQTLLHASGITTPTQAQRDRVIETMLEPLAQLEVDLAGREQTPQNYQDFISAGYKAGDAVMTSAMRVIQELAAAPEVDDQGLDSL